MTFKILNKGGCISCAAIFLLLPLVNLIGQSSLYEIEYSQRSYEELASFDILFDGRIQDDFGLGYRYDFLLGFQSSYFNRSCESMRIFTFGDATIRFNVSGTISGTQSDFLKGPYSNLAKINPNRPTYIKKGHLETDSMKIVVIQFENLGLRPDIQSNDPSDHYINFQVWYHHTGDIDFVMGPSKLDESRYFDENMGYLNSNLQPTGLPLLGIRYPDSNFDTIYHYIQDSYDEPFHNYGQEEIETLTGLPSEGWTVSWIDNRRENLPIDEVECKPVSGFYPLEYTGGEVLWKHTSVDSTYIGHIKPNPPEVLGLTVEQGLTTGYNHFVNMYPVETIVEEDFMIAIDRIIYYQPSGSMIQKIDLETGEVLWTSSYDFRETGENEYVIKAEIVDENLVLYGIAVNHDFEIEIAQRGVLFTRTYNLETGELIRHTVADKYDNQVFEDSYALEYRKEFDQIGKDTFEILEYDFENDRPIIIRNRMGLDGIPYLSDTIIGVMEEGSLTDQRQIDDYKLHRISKDSIVFIECFEPEDDSNPESFFIIHMVNSDFEPYYTRTYDRSILGDFNGIFIEDANHSHMRLRTYFPTTRHFMFDTKTGENIGTRFEDERFDDFRLWDIQETKMTDSLEIVAVIINKFGNGIDSEEEGELEFIYSTPESDSTTNFLIPTKDRYYMFPNEVILLPDKDVILRMRESRWAVSGGYLPGFWSYMRIDSEELLGITSTNNLIELPSFVVSPNPTSNHVTITYPRVFNGRILLYNSEGYLVKKAFCNNEIINLDITDLPSGLYTIRSIGNDSSIEYKTQKLIITR